MIPIEMLHRLLRLEPETGRLYWRERTPEMFRNPSRCAAWNARWAGAEAFTAVGPDGYQRGKIFHAGYLKHRVVFAMTHGRWPDEADHRDVNRANNRPGNLRDATRAQNMANSRGHKDSRSGFKGVSPHGRGWVARCRIDGTNVRLGTFSAAIDAARAYDAAMVSAFGAFARTNFPAEAA